MFEKVNRSAIEKGIQLMDSLLKKHPHLVHCIMARAVLNDIASCPGASEYFYMRAIHELSLVIAGFTNNREPRPKDVLKICKVLAEITASAE